MSTLYITEFCGLQSAPYRDPMPAAMTPPEVHQAPVTISGASAQSAAFGASTRLVRVQSDVNCHIDFGANPTATTEKMPLSAGTPEYFQVPLGSTHKVAVIAGA